MLLKKLTKFFSTGSFKFQHDSARILQQSKLPCGITLVTEKTQFPYHSDCGIGFKAGIRDEKPDEKGSLFNLKLRSIPRIVNLCMLIIYLSENKLKTGCFLDFNFDQELSYWKCSFLQEDIDHMLNTIMRLALNRKTISKEHRDYLAQNKQPPNPIPFTETILKAAYKDQPLGNSATQAGEFLPQEEAFSRFQQQLMTPQNLVVGYSGVWTHEQFRDLFERNLVQYGEFLSRQYRGGTKAKFVSNHFAQEQDTEEINVAVLFEGYSWDHKDMGIFQIAKTVLGESSSWSTGGPGKGMRARTTLNLMNKVASVELANTINHHFTDSGVFGLHLSGLATSRHEILRVTLEELKKMIELMTDEEFNRAKNLLKCNIFMSLEAQEGRLEETSKNLFTFGTYMVDEYGSYLDSISKEQMQEKLRELILKSEPTVVYSGKGAKDMPSLEAVKQMLRR